MHSALDGFSGAAVFTVLKSLRMTHKDGTVAESLLHVGGAVVRCEDTARTRVQVIKPLG